MTFNLIQPIHYSEKNICTYYINRLLYYFAFRVVQNYIKHIEPKAWKNLVEYIFDDKVLEVNDKETEVLVKTGNGVELKVLQLPLKYQNKFHMAIMPGVENHGTRWILIIKIDDENNGHPPVTEVLAMLKNPTLENIEELNISSK